MTKDDPELEEEKFQTFADFCAEAGERTKPFLYSVGVIFMIYLLYCYL